ncbi:MAG: hypothetical protein WC750_01565 [Patescibacteria group bacterium]|jgi:hypothetical protein
MKNKEDSFFSGVDTLVGWYGAGAILIAYALTSFGVLRSDSLVYQLLNLTGGLGIVVISLTKKAYQPAVLNIVWSVVAIVAVISILTR